MTAWIVGCPEHKKDLKAMIGQRVTVVIPECFEDRIVLEYTGAIVGPGPYKRNWYASIVVEDEILKKVK